MTTSRQRTDRASRIEPGTPSGQDHEVRGAALVRLAEELKLTSTDVDELVYDMVHRDASDAYNSGLTGQVTALVAAFGE